MRIYLSNCKSDLQLNPTSVLCRLLPGPLLKYINRSTDHFVVEYVSQLVIVAALYILDWQLVVVTKPSLFEHEKFDTYYFHCPFLINSMQSHWIEAEKTSRLPDLGRYIFFKFHGIVQCTYILLGIISWLLFYLIWENCVLHWDFDLKFWIVDVYTHITHKKYHTKQLLFFQKCRKLYKLLLKTIYIFPVVCSWLSSGKNVWRGPVQYLPLGWVTLIT